MEILLLKELKQNGVKATDIVDHISVLPLSLLQECYRSTEESFDKLEKRETLTGLFHYLNGQVWNFIDYHASPGVRHFRVRQPTPEAVHGAICC